MNLSSTTTNSLPMDMNQFFICRNGDRTPWTSVCNGSSQCSDGSDEQNCDIYACLQGNNVSCKIACATYGRVTCLTYLNVRACEHYTRKYTTTMYTDESSTKEAFIYIDDLDMFRYSVYLAIGIVVFICILSILIYFARKKPSELFSSCLNKSHFNRKSTARLSAVLREHQSLSSPSSANVARSRYAPPPNIHDYTRESSTSSNDHYEPPFYSGPCLLSSINYSDSIYYETIKTPSTSNSMSMLQPLPLPEPQDDLYMRTHCV
ncbi:unnamed protein product [Adineta ricciae]|uniref:Uncharacterized protein n=1 Tax=Adineta ricciae TaxID=249248 RepID=A0A813X8Z6_ADIRI|nr:unnamed protein product [Adineta ricciae]